MSIAVRAEREGDRARLVPVGAFDVAHAPAVARAVAHVQPDLEGCRSIDVDLTHLDRIDGAGAVLLARLLDRLDADGGRTRMLKDCNPEAARLIALYRQKRAELPPARTSSMSALAKIGALAADLPARFTNTLDFTGEAAFDVSALSPGGKTMFAAGNLNQSSLFSEIFASEVLYRCDQADFL